MEFPDLKIRAAAFTRRQPGTQLGLAITRAEHKITRVRTRFILALIALTTALMATAKADPIATCAVPPVGCTNQDAKCICDASGNCHWIYNCTHR